MKSLTLALSLVVVVAFISSCSDNHGNPHTSSGSTDKATAISCKINLRTIDGVKAVWAEQRQKGTNDIPIEADLSAPGLIRDRNIFVCPGGGKYTLGRVGERPTCSIPEHKF